LNMDKYSNFLPSTDYLSVLAKGHIPENTWLDVKYNELLENQSKEMIELQVFQFLYGITTKKGKPYLNEFSSLYEQFDDLLKDIKKKGVSESKSTDGLTTEEIWHILDHEVLNPNTPLGLLKQGFFWISILGATRGSKHVNLHVSQIIDMPDNIILKKTQQKND
ncbi:8358_t:CDS:2, partial [Cetraspora pellucida]